MTIIEDQQAQYLIKSLQHHPSPYLILTKEAGVEWMNKSAQYVFDTTEISDGALAVINQAQFAAMNGLEVTDLYGG